MKVQTVVNGVVRRGFTLVEVLVTAVVVGVLAAVIVPAVIKQTTAGDPTRMASDLSSVKSGIEIFAQNVRPRMPGDIEDLLVQISTTGDLGLDGQIYDATDRSNWKGPYLEWTTSEITNAATGVTVFKTAGGVVVENALFRCPTSSTSWPSTGTDGPCTHSATTSGNTTESYASVKMTGIASNSTEFTNLNTIIDGVDESNPTTSGLLRQNASGTVFYLAVPYTAP